nr:carotenoid 9,10(9',10')-cleavage dioxygenase [Quercus suber]
MNFTANEVIKDKVCDKLGDLTGLFGLIMMIMRMLRVKLKVLDISYGTGTGNTALIYHHGKLLALQEADKPYVLKVLEDGDLQTLGMLDYDKRLAHSFPAHPKVDPFTANAWEEEDEVVLITCGLKNFDMDRLNGIVKEELKTFSSELQV